MSNTNCVHCNNSTTNPKFCSRSCAAKFNNKTSPKRAKTEKRKIRDSNRLERENKTLGDYIYRSTYKSNVYGNIRHMARLVVADIPNVCINCGYSRHVEVCHIKAISTFPHTTKLKDINNKDNLVKLCKNCHWEFDNNLLNLVGLLGIEPRP